MNPKAPYLPRERISGRTALWSFALGVGLVAPLIIVLASLPLPRPADGGAAQQARYLDYVQNSGVLFLKAVIVMPLLEEIFYRGIILQLLRRYSPVWFAVFFSAAFFGVTHIGQSAATGVNAFILGCLFAWLVLRAQSLFPAIICHSAFNLSWLFLIGPAFGVTDRMAQGQVADATNALRVFPVWWIVISLGLVTAASVILVSEFSKKKPNKAPEPTTMAVTSPAAQEPRQP